MHRFKYFIYVFILVVLAVAFSVYAVNQDSKNSGEPGVHLNNQIFNEYVADLIKSREPEIKAAVMSNEDITDFHLKDASFDIETGKLTLQFKVQYKKKNISGKLGFEVRASNEVSPQIGGYCLGLEGKLHSDNLFANMVLAFTTSHFNKNLAGKEFWPDKQSHSQYQVFKNSNLASIMNQIMASNGALNGQFPQFTQNIPGGTLQVDFKDIICRSFDTNAGQAQIDSGISVAVKSEFLGATNIPNAGSLESYFDFYVNPADKSWWARLNALKIKMNMGPEINSMAQKIIDKHLKDHQVLIALNMPKVNP
jgi:hypothetical protein